MIDHEAHALGVPLRPRQPGRVEQEQRFGRRGVQLLFGDDQARLQTSTEFERKR